MKWKIKENNKRGFDYCVDGGVIDILYPSSSTRRSRVKEEGRMSPTIEANGIPHRLEAFRYECNGSEYFVRIRKLTPNECWRLMGFKDEDFRKAEAVNSNTQLYRQAGNSIVKPVLEAIFGGLYD